MGPRFLGGFRGTEVLWVPAGGGQCPVPTQQPQGADKKYSIGISDYYANGGFYDSLKDATLTKLYPDQNCKTLADFIEYDLGGVVGEEYRESQGRITFIED